MLCQSRLSLKYFDTRQCENRLYDLQELLQQSLWKLAFVNACLLPERASATRPSHLHLVHFLSVPGCGRQPLGTAFLTMVLFKHSQSFVKSYISNKNTVHPFYLWAIFDSRLRSFLQESLSLESLHCRRHMLKMPSVLGFFLISPPSLNFLYVNNAFPLFAFFFLF